MNPQLNETLKEAEVLVDTAVLGKLTLDFLQSDVGRYLNKCIDDEYAEGLERLKTVDAANAEAVRSAQNQVWRADELRRWLQTAIHAGVRATQVLESREDD
jgi:hypothetical protein